jgi:hypothetical protein
MISSIGRIEMMLIRLLVNEAFVEDWYMMMASWQLKKGYGFIIHACLFENLERERNVRVFWHLAFLAHLVITKDQRGG